MMNVINSVLLIGPIVLQAWLIYLLFLRRVAHQFKFFSLYTGFSVLAQILRFITNADRRTYYYVYWASEAVYAVLGFFAINEAFRRIFRVQFIALKWFKFLPVTIGAATLTAAVVDGIFFPPIDARPMLATIVAAEIAVRCLQGALFCLLSILVRLHRVSLQNQAFGISLGFAVAGFGILLTFMLRSVFGTRFNSAIRFGPPLAYITAVVIWLSAFVKAEPLDPFLGPNAPRLTTEQIERLTGALKDATEEMKG
ncbi:MAG TPA: hypothetical protein VKZ53_27840 [Candidatus Angelobacter sp.]|nr:hypothetical protein [Candidatus Angelobacter sp.]